MGELYQRYLQGKITRKKAYISVDHKRPLSKGGKWEIGNLLTACMPCNTAKGNHYVDEEET